MARNSEVAIIDGAEPFFMIAALVDFPATVFFEKSFEF